MSDRGIRIITLVLFVLSGLPTVLTAENVIDLSGAPMMLPGVRAYQIS